MLPAKDRTDQSTHSAGPQYEDVRTGESRTFFSRTQRGGGLPAGQFSVGIRRELADVITDLAPFTPSADSPDRRYG